MNRCEIVALVVCVGILIAYIVHNHGHFIG
jgi:hypothetical protein